MPCAWPRALQNQLNADRSDYTGLRRPCPCGGSARFVDRRNKTVQTVLGDIELERAYYHCARCKQGICPRGQGLGMTGPLSPGVARMSGNVGARVSFEEGSLLILQLAGLNVSAKQIERSAEALGAEIARDETTDLTPMEQSALPQTLYLGIDGTGVPIRTKELAGRPGKQTDGSSKTREVKLCTVWSAEGRDEHNGPVRDPGSVTYSAAIESAATLDVSSASSPFTQRVGREATRRRFSQAERMAILGDGAP